MSDVPVAQAQSVLQSLQVGVVPHDGLQHLAVGRVAELRQSLRELEVLRRGGGVFRVVVGAYGAGKTFFLRLVRQVALTQGYVVADADLGPELRLRGDGRGLATYRHLMANLASDSRPDGGALTVVLDRWCDGVRGAAAARLGLPGAQALARTPEAAQALDLELRVRLEALRTLPGGFGWASTLRRYLEAAVAGDDERTAAAIRWVRGEYRTRAELRATLGLADVSPVSDADWPAHLRLLALTAVQAGHQGLLVLLDECGHLATIPQPDARSSNYEVLLGLLNDALQGRAHHLGLYVAGPPEFLTDPRRGLFSYPALATRLKPNPYADEAHRDLAQPVLELPPLRAEELLALFLKVRALHAGLYGESRLDPDGVGRFVQELLARPGASRFLTPREALRAFVQALNLLEQHPELAPAAVLDRATEEIAAGRFVPLAP